LLLAHREGSGDSGTASGNDTEEAPTVALTVHLITNFGRSMSRVISRLTPVINGIIGYIRRLTGQPVSLRICPGYPVYNLG
jgi:hypothetical protein